MAKRFNHKTSISNQSGFVYPSMEMRHYSISRQKNRLSLQTAYRNEKYRDYLGFKYVKVSVESLEDGPAPQVNEIKNVCVLGSYMEV